MEEQNNKKNKNKKLIVTIMIILLIIVLGVAIFMFIKQNSSISQIDKLDKAVKDNDFSRIATILSNNDTNISKQEAEQFVKYIKKDDNYSNYKDDIKTIKKSIKSDKEYDVQKGKITDNKGKTLIDVRQNGKKLFLFDKINFVPHKYNVYVKEYDNKATYQYELGKKMKTDAEPNKETLIGKFFVGSYKIDTQKTIKNSVNNGELNGQLIVDTEKRDKNNKIIAEDSFNQSWFKAHLNNKDKLDKNSLKLHVNGHTEEYTDNKVYGKLSNQEDVKVFATGSVHGEEFKTNTLRLDRNHDNEPQELELDFDKDKIEEYIENYKKIKSKSQKFIKDYNKDLTKAYEKNNPMYIEDYFDKETKLYKQAEKDIKNKSNKNRQYEVLDIKEVNLNENDDEVELIAKTKISHREMNVKYTLDLGYKNKYFKIKAVNEN